MQQRPHPISLAALVAALAALVVALVVLFGGGQQPTVSVGAGASTVDQQHIVAAAAAAPNPGCAVPQGAGRMGICAQNRGALAVADATAPAGNKVPTTSSGHTGGIGAVILGTAEAAGTVDRGEDVANHQGCSINWSARRGYLSFVQYKDGEGGGFTDVCAPHNTAGTATAGLAHGTYYFDRTTVSPELEADRAAAIDRRAGFDPKQRGSLPHTIDMETNDAGLSSTAACSHVSRYVIRYERDTGRYQMFVYTSQGTNPAGSCPLLPAGTIVWNAAYGPVWNVVLGRQPCEWQYSDGRFGPTPHLDGGDSDIWICSHQQLVQLANAVPPIPAPTAIHYTRCGTLRWLRNHGQGSTAGAGDVRNSLVADKVACPDHTAVRTGYPPKLPQPSPDEFRECRGLLAWRAAGRPAAQRAHEIADRSALVRAGVRCNGRPPLVAVR